jgi:hypothetical protein
MADRCVEDLTAALGYEAERPLDWHIIPGNDVRLHIVSVDCWCQPTDENGIIVHHSLDGREFRELPENLTPDN